MSTKPSKPTRAAKGKGKNIQSEDDFEDSPSLKPTRNQQLLPTPESKTSSSRQKGTSEDNKDTKPDSQQSNPDQNILFQEVDELRQTLKRKELEGNEFMILQQKDKILKQLEPVLGGFEPIDEPHRTYFLSLIRDIMTGYPPVNPRNVMP